MPIAVLAAVATVLAFGFTRRPQIIAEGCFHQVAHKGRGCASLIRHADGKTVLQLTDFATSENPDLRVLLISANDALENNTVVDSRRVDLGPLHVANGEQEYFVPTLVDVRSFNAVTVWNERHQVNFTTAPLKWR